jgi:hypothetical protein
MISLNRLIRKSFLWSKKSSVKKYIKKEGNNKKLKAPKNFNNNRIIFHILKNNKLRKDPLFS